MISVNNISEMETEGMIDLLSSRLIELRLDQNGMSQAELAKKLGTSQNYIYRLENGLKVSLTSFIEVYLFYCKNMKLNSEWFWLPDNTGIPKYLMSTKINRKAKENKDQARLQIINKLMKEMNELDKQSE